MDGRMDEWAWGSSLPCEPSALHSIGETNSIVVIIITSTAVSTRKRERNPSTRIEPMDFLNGMASPFRYI